MKRESAFPISSIEDGHLEIFYGLTKIEYFAAKALQGLCANPNTNYAMTEALSALAVEHAHSIINILENESIN